LGLCLSLTSKTPNPAQSFVSQRKVVLILKLPLVFPLFSAHF
jgi:hypothetical protein